MGRGLLVVGVAALAACIRRDPLSNLRHVIVAHVSAASGVTGGIVARYKIGHVLFPDIARGVLPFFAFRICPVCGLRLPRGLPALAGTVLALRHATSSNHVCDAHACQEEQSISAHRLVLAPFRNICLAAHAPSVRPRGAKVRDGQARGHNAGRTETLASAVEVALRWQV